MNRCGQPITNERHHQSCLLFNCHCAVSSSVIYGISFFFNSDSIHWMLFTKHIQTLSAPNCKSISAVLFPQFTSAASKDNEAEDAMIRLESKLKACGLYFHVFFMHMDVSENSDIPKSSISIGVFHEFHHPFSGPIPIFWKHPSSPKKHWKKKHSPHRLVGQGQESGVILRQRQAADIQDRVSTSGPTWNPLFACQFDKCSQHNQLFLICSKLHNCDNCAYTHPKRPKLFGTLHLRLAS